MSSSVTIHNTTLRLMKGDITDQEFECFVFHARNDLKLGSGFGTAISIRGGPSIQEELLKLAPLKVTEVAISSAGDLKANRIIHAVGPAFQEPDLSGKLITTIQNALALADEQRIQQLAFPALGAGFYGVPLPICADVMISTITDYLETRETTLKEVVICLLDNREFKPFDDRFNQPVMAQGRQA